ncbi:MAG TPA: maleylpyruvate isomerase family mycothiol-dependent enzyme [Acidimicrobiia bacterium]|nr:maleylpyruvate isomerase family mycothiol-dependent enzyme [Acidimicrobiia bacterium]
MTDADTQLRALVDDLDAERAVLFGAVATIDPDDWFRATAAHGWDIRDAVAHLADTDEVAIDTMLDGPRALARFAATRASSEDVTFTGVLRGRRRSGRAVLDWCRATTAAQRDALLTLRPDTRVPWGLGMRAPSFVTARLMETWAHSLDVHTALGVGLVDTDRLRHVAWIAIRALPYAYSVAGREPPAEPVRFELVAPNGELWEFGPPDAAAQVRGSAAHLCRVFVQRRAWTDSDLVAEGDAAISALQVARAYL